jgi:hypothetical protein
MGGAEIKDLLKVINSSTRPSQINPEMEDLLSVFKQLDDLKN